MQNILSALTGIFNLNEKSKGVGELPRTIWQAKRTVASLDWSGV